MRGDEWAESRQRAKSLGLRSIEQIDEVRIDWQLLEHLPYRFAREKAILPLSVRPDGGLDALVADPLDIEAVEMARFLLKRPLFPLIAPRKKILVWLDSTYEKWAGRRHLSANIGESHGADLHTRARGVSHGGNFRALCDLLDQKEHSEASQLLSDLLCQAVEQRASDLHFEPCFGAWRVRYRIDGTLHVRATISPDLQRKIAIRIKALARLDIAECRRPQDGHLQVRVAGRDIDLRISTLFVAEGERIALRLLDQSRKDLTLSSLQLPSKIESAFCEQLRAPHGLLLVCGPTGSGKTTTLYSALSDLQREKNNIMTIEDPIEYRLQGISQMNIQPSIGLDFAAGLRHLLRQDPDVLLLGEMRDTASAQIAFRAALTGHLVLSTLHAKSAVGAFARLLELGIELNPIFSCLNGILYQRLVRQLCPHCKHLIRVLRSDRRSAQNEHPCTGCPHCHHTGYWGRRAVFEWLPIDQQSASASSMSRSPHRPSPIAESTRFAEGLIPLHHHAQQLLREEVSCQKELQSLL